MRNECSACRRKHRPQKKQGGKRSVRSAEEVVSCWFDCLAGAAVEAGGCVVAHGRQLQAMMLLFQAAERDSSSSSLL